MNLRIQLTRGSRRRRLTAWVVFIVVLTLLAGGSFTLVCNVIAPGLPLVLSRLGLPSAGYPLNRLKAEVENIPGVVQVGNLREGGRDLWVSSVDGYLDVTVRESMTVHQARTAAKAIAKAIRREQTDYAALHVTLIFGRLKVPLSSSDLLNLARLSTALQLSKVPQTNSVAITWSLPAADSPNVDASNSGLTVTVALLNTSTVSLSDTVQASVTTSHALAPNGQLIVEREHSKPSNQLGSPLPRGLERVELTLYNPAPSPSVLNWIDRAGTDSRILGYVLSEPTGKRTATVEIGNSRDKDFVERDFSDLVKAADIKCFYYVRGSKPPVIGR